MAQKQKNSQQDVALEGASVVHMRDLGLEGVEPTHVSPKCFAEYIRALRQNWRQGTVACKGRSEVAFSNKKPWKQKGTGRARSGAKSSPIWRKGGVTFGPQPRTRVLDVPQEMRKAVMRALFFEALQQGRICSLSYEAQGDRPSTAQAYNALQRAGLAGKKVMFLTSVEDALVHASFANIPTVRLYLFDQVNGYALADAAYWVYLQKDVDMFKQMVQQWI